MDLHEITPGVFACMQEDRGLGWSNSGLVNRGGGLVVDTFWDLPHTRALIDTYARVWKAPARRVVNTHHNGDHCWGNQLFAGAEIIAHRLCAEAMRRESPAGMQALQQVGAGTDADAATAWFAARLSDWDFAGVEVTPPTTLMEDRLDLDLDGLELQLLYVGPAHTAGDVIVWLPEPRVLFAGDILFRRCTPIGWEGTFAGWIGALDRMLALAPEVVVPGHGPLSGAEGLQEMRDYLQYVRAESERHFEAGRSELEAARQIDLGPYADWTEPERLIFNVARAYRELRGDPWDAPIDTGALLRGMYALRDAFSR